MMRVFRVLGLVVSVGFFSTIIPFVGVAVGYYNPRLRFSVGFWWREFVIQVERGE